MEIKFSMDVNYLNVLEEDDNILLTKMYVVSTGDSRPVDVDGKACITSFSLDSLKKASITLPNKPIVCVWNEWKCDFTDHARTDMEKKKRVIVGVVPETCDMDYEEVNGQTFLTCKVVFWKKYFPDLVNKIANNTLENKSTNLSMEIDVLDGHYDNEQYFIVDDFCFVGISLLGENIKTGIADAKMDTIKFSAIDDSMIDEANKFIINYNEKKGESIKMTYRQKMELLNGSLEDCWVLDFDDSYVYFEDYSEDCCKTFRAKYTIEDTKATIDTANKEQVIKGGYVAVGTTTMTYSEALESCKTLETKCSELEASVTDLKESCTSKDVKFSEIETNYSTVSKELEDLKVSYSSTKDELTNLKEETIAKYSRLNELEVMFSEQEDKELLKNAKSIVEERAVYFSEDEQKSLLDKFEKEFKSKEGLIQFSTIVKAEAEPKIQAQYEALKQQYENIATDKNKDGLVFSTSQITDTIGKNTENLSSWERLGYTK